MDVPGVQAPEDAAEEIITGTVPERGTGPAATDANTIVLIASE
jgi:hypothetical protein